MAKIHTIKGKKYMRAGDKLVLIDHFDADGNPVIGCWSEETPNTNGGQDCTVHVECFQIASIPHKPT